MRPILLGCLAVFCAAAQPAAEPPPIIQIVRKVGTSAPPQRQYGSAGAALNAIGMTSITGLPETWLVELHDSFGSIEILDKGLVAVAPKLTADPADPLQEDVLAPARTLVALYRHYLSYRPEQAIRMFPRARYFHMTLYRVRIGTESEFAELVKLRRLNLDSVNLDRPDIAYQVVSGAPSGTYVFLAPLASLRTMDDAVASLPFYAETLARSEAKTAAKVSAQAELSREHLLFRVEPRISYVSDGFAEADAGFWRGKPR
jgi:hypothetical protein